MDMNWSTFLLEIVNFLILVWILQRFFYKPVRQAIETRRQGIEKTLAEAKKTQAEAGAMKAQYEKRLTDWEAEKQAARIKLQSELGEEGKRQMDALQEALGLERKKSRSLEEKHLAEALRQNELTALQQAALFATRLLERVAGPELNGRLAEVFVEDFKNLPQEKKALAQSAKTIKVASAFPLEEKQREAVANGLGQKTACEFSVDPRLIAGLRVSIGSHVLQASLQDELKFFSGAEDDRHAA